MTAHDSCSIGQAAMVATSCGTNPRSTDSELQRLKVYDKQRYLTREMHTDPPNKSQSKQVLVLFHLCL